MHIKFLEKKLMAISILRIILFNCSMDKEIFKETFFLIFNVIIGLLGN